jgi:RNA polymerase sigma-70 factor (ECF subfamily)
MECSALSHFTVTAMIAVRTRKKMTFQTQSASDPPTGDPQGACGDMSVLVAHLNAAYNLARWLMRDETEAEEAVQEAYLRAISHFGSCRGGDARAWLLTILRNLCYDRMKHKSVSAQNTNFDEALHSTRQTFNPETELLRTETCELVTKSLASLSAEFREVLVLRELEQFSYQEIADIVGIPLGTVMSRLSRARQHLQRALSEATGERLNLAASAKP